MKEKPILFNTEMVCDILEGRKTQTRRVIKPHNPVRAKLDGYKQGYGLLFSETRDNTADKWYIKDYSVSPCWISDRNYIKEFAPYKPGDVLWVRETWAEMPYGYVYRADGKEPEGWDPDDRWHPSIHMPREAARIFLQVKGVRVERLQAIQTMDAVAEGAGARWYQDEWGNPIYEDTPIDMFSELWDSTIKKSDLPRYGWNENPWVWVISFERMDGMK